MYIKLKAEVFRLGLLINYFQIEEIIQWVDKIIEMTDVEDIPYLYFDLSLTKDKGKIVELLGLIEEQIEEKDLPTKILLGLLYEDWQSQESKTIIQMANDLAINSFMTMDNDLLFGTIVALVDQYEEALKGYGNPFCPEETIKEYVSEAVEVIKDFLTDYKEYAKIWRESNNS